jgi:hypothetical protein
LARLFSLSLDTGEPPSYFGCLLPRFFGIFSDRRSCHEASGEWYLRVFVNELTHITEVEVHCLSITTTLLAVNVKRH